MAEPPRGRLQRTTGYATIRALRKPDHVLYDLKYLPPAADSDLRL
jgi:UDP-N-acetyl-D-galactosamine dehydrogenase